MVTISKKICKCGEPYLDLREHDKEHHGGEHFD